MTNEHHAKHIMPFDISEAQRSNILLTGTNQQGKSLCTMQIADILMRNNWQIICFDNVGHWKEKSSIPIFYKVSETTMSYVLTNDSIIYDISLLLPTYQREFCENILNDIWKRNLKEKTQKWTLIIFEEFQLYARNIRGNISQNILRIMSVGANHRIRCLGITPDLSLIDCAFIRLANQRYHFKLGNEPNAKRRFNAYYGKDYTRVVQELDVGFCLYYINEKLKVWKIPEFKSYRKPIEYIEPQPIKPKPKKLYQRILSVFSNGLENDWYEEQEENDLREIEEEFPEEW